MSHAVESAHSTWSNATLVHATNLNQAAYEVQEAAKAVVAAVGAYVSAVEAERHPEPRREDVPQQPAESEGLSEVEKAEARRAKKPADVAAQNQHTVVAAEEAADRVVNGDEFVGHDPNVNLGSGVYQGAEDAAREAKRGPVTVVPDTSGAPSTGVAPSFTQPVDEFVPIGEDERVEDEKARAAKAEADAHAATSTLNFPQPVDENAKAVATKAEADQAAAKVEAAKARADADKAAAAAQIRTTPAGEQGRTF